MNFLVIEQDLRVSGTSQGIISRSFLAKLRESYPESTIDVVYLKRHKGDDQLDLLPVDSIKSHVLHISIPFLTKWLNKVYWRLFHVSLRERYIHKTYASYIQKIDYQNYDHIFIRSAGLDHETILGSKDLPILRRAIVNFHDPYPVYWYAGSNTPLTNLEIFRMKKMQKVVSQAKICMSSAHTMSRDMSFLYGSKKDFYVLPHQYCDSVFDLSNIASVYKKNKPITIAYHGAIQFGRDILILLNAYQELLEENYSIQEQTELVLRVKGVDLKVLQEKYSHVDNITIMGTLNFSNSAYEQKYETDINIILENGPLYSNILVGKAPFLASTEKPVLVLSPAKSELASIVDGCQYIARYDNKEEIKLKLKNLILDRLSSSEPVRPFGNYFSTKNFKQSMDKVLGLN